MKATALYNVGCGRFTYYIAYVDSTFCRQCDAKMSVSTGAE